MEEVFLTLPINYILQKLVSSLDDILAEDFMTPTSSGFFKAQLKSLRTRFRDAQDLLYVVEKQEFNSEEKVQIWLKKLQALAFDAEDVLDEFMFQVVLKNRIRSKVHNFSLSNNPLVFRRKMAHKLNTINLSLHQIIIRDATSLHLRGVLSSYVEPIQEFPYVLGRDHDVSIVVDMVVDSNYNDEFVPVIAIVGVAGLGKTVLADLVCKHEKVVSNFDTIMRIHVSLDFTVERLLNDMAYNVTEGHIQIQDREKLVKRIRENLDGKKYFLVLDDAIWIQNQRRWKEMRDSLLRIGGARGSKVLVNIRSLEAESAIQTSVVHYLTELSAEDSWTMFKQIAFADGGPEETPNLVNAGKRIVENCKGIPQEIKTLACLMYSLKQERQWMSMTNHEIWSSEGNENDALPALRLCFDHLLSLPQKQCLAYCSIFPKDYVIERNKIIQLWMALGYLQPSQGSNQTMEDIGNNFFKKFLKNSLLEDVEKDYYGKVTCCKMLDRVHDLALHVFEKQCLTLKSGEVMGNWKGIHLSLLSDEVKFSEIPKRIAENLRTLFSTLHPSGNILTDFRCLQVLNLAESGLVKLPSSISRLIHLRYLDLSLTFIERLPNSLTKLYNLQTLRLLDNLDLEELPKSFWKLASLRHFYIDDNRGNRLMIGRLASLQTLPFFAVGEDKGRRIEELGCLSNLKGVLKIYNLQLVKGREEAQKAKLSTNPKIHELKFDWECNYNDSHVEDRINNDEDVLEGLEPNGNLKGLIIENFKGGKFATWMMGDSQLLQNLVKIILKNCSRCEQIPTLGQLAGLKYVEIVGLHNLKRIGTEFYGHGVSRHNVGVGCSNCSSGGSSVVGTTAFPALRELILSDMQSLEEWSDELFPCLEKLKIWNCPRLMSTPGQFPSLMELSVKNINSEVMESMNISKLYFLSSLEITSVSGSQLNIVLEEFLKSSNLSLKTLQLHDCKELCFLPNDPEYFASLEKLDKEAETRRFCGLRSVRVFTISGCNELTCFPKEMLQNLESVEILEVTKCANLITIPDEIRCLKNLQKLEISHCERLISLPEGLLFLPRLQKLVLGDFSKELENFPWPNSSTNAAATAVLQELELIGWPKLNLLPDQLQHLTALIELKIKNFNGLEALPPWFSCLSSLRSLDLYNCKEGQKIACSRLPIIRVH